MAEFITLTAADGHALRAYRADPVGKPRGGIVVIQEIFGVNAHIRDVTERFAEVGYVAIAPAVYDRFAPGFECGYEPDDIAKGRELKTTANENFENVMLDVEAARAAIAGEAGRVGVTGYCWGGVVTWAAACRLDFQAASCYYGAGILPMIEERPKCPTILHFGDQDASIPLDVDVKQVKEKHPDCPAYVYAANHGFNCDMRGQYNPRAAHIAGMRTIMLFEDCLARGMDQ